MYIYIYACVYIYIHIYATLHSSLCFYGLDSLPTMSGLVRLLMHVYIYIYMCVYLNMYIYIYMYVCYPPEFAAAGTTITTAPTTATKMVNPGWILLLGLFLGGVCFFCCFSLVFPRENTRFLYVLDGFGVIFLGFPTKKHSLVLDFPSGKHCFSYILDGFGVIPVGFPREDLH